MTSQNYEQAHANARRALAEYKRLYELEQACNKLIEYSNAPSIFAIKSDILNDKAEQKAIIQQFDPSFEGLAYEDGVE